MSDFHILKLDKILYEDFSLEDMYHSEDFNLFLESIPPDILPNLNISEITSEDIIGSIFLNSSYDSRSFELGCIMVTDIPDELSRDFNKFLHLLYSNNPLALVLKDHKDRFIHCNLNGKIETHLELFYQKLPIPLLAPDPFWYSVSLHKQYYMGPQQEIISNIGNYHTRPLIKIEGPATNPTITIGDQIASYTGSLTSTDTILIDCKRFSIKFNSASGDKAFNKVFPMIHPGNNQISINSGKVTITYRDCWL